MEENVEKRTVTPMDVAKFLGVEKEYREALNEEELKKNHDIIMSDDVEKNNTMENDS
jgi:hypothetical protein